MLTWPHSAVVTDLKREIFELTSGWRWTEGKNRILRFEPASSTHSVAFNPIDEIRVGTDHETGDMQNLATLIVDPDGKGLHTLAEDSLRAHDRLYCTRIVSPEKREGPRHVAGS